MNKAFSLIELLVVIAIITLMLAITLPSLSKARRQAKVLKANSDIRQIGICLDMYARDNRGNYPPTRKDCNKGWDDHQLPPELVEGGYLPSPRNKSIMSSNVEDVFNRGNTYRYWAVGEVYQNDTYVERLSSALYVPPGFPNESRRSKPEDDVLYSDPDSSPVLWTVYSEGPKFDYWDMIKTKNGPVPRRCWYDPAKGRGLIVRVGMRNGSQIGTFEGD